MRASLCAPLSALIVACGAPAHAITLYSNNFDTENGGTGATALNYAAFAGLSVPLGPVDLVKNGDFGISCAGGNGSCVDLDGSKPGGEAGVLITDFFRFQAGEDVSFSFDISGNQRTTTVDHFNIGMNFTDPILFNSMTLTFGSRKRTLVSNYIVAGVFTGDAVSGGSFTRVTMSFNASQAGSFYAVIGEGELRSDGIGPIVDNVQVNTSRSMNGVPEPSIWAMLLLGFFGAGTQIRRRSIRELT